MGWTTNGLNILCWSDKTKTSWIFYNIDGNSNWTIHCCRLHNNELIDPKPSISNNKPTIEKERVWWYCPSHVDWLCLCAQWILFATSVETVWINKENWQSSTINHRQHAAVVQNPCLEKKTVEEAMNLWFTQGHWHLNTNLLNKESSFCCTQDKVTKLQNCSYWRVKKGNNRYTSTLGGIGPKKE